MNDMNEISRRTVVRLGGAGAAAAALVLSGCAPSSDSNSSPGDAGGSGATPPSQGGSGASESAAPPASGTEIAQLSAVPVGESLGVVVGGASLLIAQPTAGEVVGFSAICSHQQCIVAAAGSELHCPCHGSRFDAATGEVLQGPAVDPLTPVAVRVEGTSIVAG